MRLTPLRSKVLVHLDEEVRKIGRFFLPDQDFITYCPDCRTFSPEPGENPRQRCIPEEIWEDDVKRNRWIPRAIRTAHNITTVARKTAAGATVRTGVVVTVGAGVSLKPGDQIMIGYTAGREVAEDWRIVNEHAVLAEVSA